MIRPLPLSILTFLTSHRGFTQGAGLWEDVQACGDREQPGGADEEAVQGPDAWLCSTRLLSTAILWCRPPTSTHFDLLRHGWKRTVPFVKKNNQRIFFEQKCSLQMHFHLQSKKKVYFKMAGCQKILQCVLINLNSVFYTLTGIAKSLMTKLPNYIWHILQYKSKKSSSKLPIQVQHYNQKQV